MHGAFETRKRRKGNERPEGHGARPETAENRAPSQAPALESHRSHDGRNARTDDRSDQARYDDGKEGWSVHRAVPRRRLQAVSSVPDDDLDADKRNAAA